jgi:hypothetical protein
MLGAKATNFFITAIKPYFHCGNEAKISFICDAINFIMHYLTASCPIGFFVQKTFKLFCCYCETPAGTGVK